MIKTLQRRFALSKEGAVDLIKGCIACVAQDISFMFPVGLLYYFVIDTKSGGITQYESFREAKEVYPSIETDLTHLEVFYYKSWVWVIPLAILAFVISSGLVFIMWFIAIKIHRKSI